MALQACLASVASVRDLNRDLLPHTEASIVGAPWKASNDMHRPFVTETARSYVAAHLRSKGVQIPF